MSPQTFFGVILAGVVYLITIFGMCLVDPSRSGQARRAVERGGRALTAIRRSEPARAYDPVSGEVRHPAIAAWTPVEREVLGINDTDRFIYDLDKKLRAASPALPSAEEIQDAVHQALGAPSGDVHVILSHDGSTITITESIT